MPKRPSPYSFYAMEINTLEKLKQAQETIQKFKQKLAQSVFIKQEEINMEIPKEFKEKCLALLNPGGKPVYKCEHCDRQFNDGRQLGGHVSKAHKEIKTSVKQKMQQN